MLSVAEKANFSQDKSAINYEQILKLTNLAENHNFSELVDSCLAKNNKKTLNILNENNSTSEDNIIIIKTFLFKLKRLRKLKKELENNRNTDYVITSYKPPIFWKDKEIVKKQLEVWSLDQIKTLINKVNDLEILIKKNTQISNQLINNFILEKI